MIENEIISGLAPRLRALGSRKETWLKILIALVVIRVWIAPLTSSLWLDETGTYWTVQHGMSEIPTRAVSPPQSLLYFFIVGAAVAIGGAREVALRLPSTIAMVFAALLLYRLGRRLLDHDAALLATLIFVCWKEVAFAASDARPYALALLTVIGAMLLLVRWLEGGRIADGVGYALLATLTVYLHYVFATVFIVHAAYTVDRVRRLGLVRFRALCGVATLIGVLLLPLIASFPRFVQSGAKYSYIEGPWLHDLIEMLAPHFLVASILAGLLFAYLIRPACSFSQSLSERMPLLLLLTWSVLPVLLLFVFSKLTPYKLFVPRYLLFATPGLALLGGWALGAIGPGRKQVWVAAFLTFGSMASWRRSDNSSSCMVARTGGALWNP